MKEREMNEREMRGKIRRKIVFECVCVVIVPFR